MTFIGAYLPICYNKGVHQLLKLLAEQEVCCLWPNLDLSELFPSTSVVFDRMNKFQLPKTLDVIHCQSFAIQLVGIVHVWCPSFQVHTSQTAAQ